MGRNRTKKTDDTQATLPVETKTNGTAAHANAEVNGAATKLRTFTRSIPHNLTGKGRKSQPTA